MLSYPCAYEKSSTPIIPLTTCVNCSLSTTAAARWIVHYRRWRSHSAPAQTFVRQAV